ncbi:putative secreted protein [Propionispora sp. 2/2-37]|uniref:S-layer protein n=1 Tax=Propionispora sp. 2/2-37 TaxID=1677858 RepID=UPI0006C491AE|nr:S-layer protein [Propionispora sp. 2/2-37]CUH97625.1 putative secreted protein [Propionispora sp. 2/2-37]
MKKILIVLFFMAAVLDVSGTALNKNAVYASDARGNGRASSQQTMLGKQETFKAEFAYEMAKLTATVVSAPKADAENFKATVAYATAEATAKVLPLLPGEQKTAFAYEMAKFTARIMNDQNLDMEKAKADFSYHMAQLTTRMITNADYPAQGALLRNNADIELKPTNSVSVKESVAIQNTSPAPNSVDPETYSELMEELTHVGDRSNQPSNKVNMDGEIRYHYAFNSGAGRWDANSSGIRARLGFDTQINEQWRANAMLEGQKSLVDYNNKAELSRFNVTGKLGSSTLQAGSFGYLMAEGNIYDSGFKGVRAVFEGPVKYTVSYGKNDDTKDTAIATARYDDFDYNLEAGIYHYRMDNGSLDENTIWTLGGNYNFSNFSIGAMVLGSSLKDGGGHNTGYVMGLHYGDLKTWRPGTYDLFTKYYNQPQGTYIAHGMNGAGTQMQGFKGYGLGMHYTLAENFVGGLEYYNLTDKMLGRQGDTWWSQVSYYF